MIVEGDANLLFGYAKLLPVKCVDAFLSAEEEVAVSRLRRAAAFKNLEKRERDCAETKW